MSTSEADENRSDADAKRSDYVGALARGLAVIEAFGRTTPELTLSEVAQLTGMSPATARRNLHTLEELGFVKRHNKRFLLAPRVLTLGSAFLQAANVDEAVMPELRRIVTLFGDAASMATLEGTDILYIAHFSELRAARRTASVGVTYPAYATSMGRILLAGLPPAELAAYWHELRPTKLTDVTVTDRDALAAIVEEARRAGYTVAVDQLDYGITSLSVPVKNEAGRVVAAINTSGYSPRLDAQKLVEERLAELQVSAGRIAHLLARYPGLAHSLLR
ncbi:IclR family transcriptional regulator domain-containing protein [Rhodoplanes roseus]|uniref:IclR family transcriptional regulator n=1 Tax=Rhodoplanes roseus TaxID=29409 RepID=A0A327KGQ4_9BRAD|nr:IclR family transcriptional regulator C-terminal domain-containing protein [Rhodoplanes roseus]RAI37919.1 IclR family transcriptional regulator [Rhodoplanes roseus]